MSDTPRTSNAELDYESDDSCCSVHFSMNGKPYEGAVCSGDEMEKLEREHTAQAKRIADLEAQVEAMKCCGNCEYGPTGLTRGACLECDNFSNWKLKARQG